MSRQQNGDSTQAAVPDETPFETFEQALERLEEIVDQLEQGDLELEQALSVFEEGVRLSRQCAGQLDAAERRIEVLVQEGGDWVARELDAPLGGGDADPRGGGDADPRGGGDADPDGDASDEGDWD